MCRMCIVEVDTGRGPALLPSCMLPVSEGMVVETASEATVKAQDGVLEFLLLNHPLDCPVCDKGGECPLQDQTMSFGPGESRFAEEKRHFPKPIPISDLVLLDRERCILCDRCTRFAKEVAGEPLIGFQNRGNHTEVNTFPDASFDSFFSGNTVQICPVGALTARPYRFKARPWDLTEVVSTFPNATGDRISVHASRNRILRIQGVDSDAVNWGWLSDRDRFSFEAVHSPERLTEPLARDAAGELAPVSWSSALAAAAEAIKDALATAGPQSVAVLGGASLSVEDQYAWVKLAKGVIGSDNIDVRLGDGLDVGLVCSLPRGTLAEAFQPGGTVLSLAGDLREEFATLFLRLRHALTNDNVSLLELSPLVGSLSHLARFSLRVRPGDTDKVVEALISPPKGEEFLGLATAEVRKAAEMVAQQPLTVLLGRSSVAESSASLERAALLLAAAAPHAKFLPLLRRGTTSSALDVGMAPGILPGRCGLAAGREFFRGVWGCAPAESGLDAHGILSAAAGGKIKVLVLLGSDPLSDFPNRRLAENALSSVGTIVALDTTPSASSRRASLLLPVAGFGERDGTHVNMEGRATALSRQITPPPSARRDWQIAAELAWLLKTDLGLDSTRKIWEELTRLSSLHAAASWDQVRSSPDGVLLTPNGSEETHPPRLQPSELAFPEVSAVPFDSYSFRLVADRTLYDNGMVVSHCPSLAALRRPARLRLNPADFDRLGVDDSNLVTATSAFGVLTAVAVPDIRVPLATAAMFLNCDGADVRDLLAADEPVCEIRIEAGT